ncbi:alpha/beta hydrolase [Nocardioides humi]|uniref:Alpha/beta hydrolase n=1 Tax=Nocardioides humi TaxID=449461 RepID=A0ABN2BXB6_9ACTN|nr:alpha/beta hydrolase [Nocardioides humi]
MTTTITLPAPVPACRALGCTPAGAQDLATDLRAVAVAVKNVQGWATSVAAPEWEGDTAEAHDHAATRFAVRLDAGEAALDRAVTAADRFEERLADLFDRREEINEDRAEVNEAIDTLRTEIAAATDDSRLEEFQRRAERLTTRAEALQVRIDTWGSDEDDAEADFIAALQAVDSVAEGEQAAADPDRPDVPALTGRLRGLLGDPVALGAWWRTLSRAEQEALTTEHPELVGNADGLPITDRDEANRGALGRDIDYYTQRKEDGQLTGAEKRILENATYVRDALDEYRDRYDPDTGAALTNLIVYHPAMHSGDGGVAISFGNPDTADHVSVNVPGLTTETSSTSGNLAKTLALHQAALAEEQGSVASVYWADYDAPSGNPLNPFDPLGQLDFGGVALTDKAEAGGERFADFIDGIRASDQGAPAHLTAIGHSYGSTTVGHALQDGLPVDDAVLIGSPGQPTPTAAELTDADVWVGSMDHDPVTLLGTGDRGGIGALGHDPADVDFGGTRFATGDGELRVEKLLDNHSSYFKGTSLDNMAHIVTGNDGEVTQQPPRGADGGEYLTLPELLTAATGASAGHALIEAGTWLWEHSRWGAIL